MKRFISAVAASLLLGTTCGAIAEPLIKDDEWKTPHSMGCMLVGDCTDGVVPVSSAADVQKLYPESDYSVVQAELDDTIRSLNTAGVNVFIGDSKYFPRLHRGAYHTVSNNFYLNQDYMHRPGVLMSVVRHEGWHAAQDCMAGTISNSLIAIIHDEEKVPFLWRDMAQSTYPAAVAPWEAEAMWAGHTEGMTQKALAACAKGKMWEEFTPTPLTAQYLRENNYIK